MADKYLIPTKKLHDELLHEWRMYVSFGWNEREILAILEELCRRGEEWERLTKENADLRLQLLQAKEQPQPQWAVGIDPAKPGADATVRVELDSAAIEPDNAYLTISEQFTPDEYYRLNQNEYPAPSGEIRYFFNIYSGPCRMADTQQERDHKWSRGPFGSWVEANDAWKAYIKRQRENGQP